MYKTSKNHYLFFYLRQYLNKIFQYFILLLTLNFDNSFYKSLLHTK
ncbi:hypothetical protein A1OE_1092 [Candidatus Endolissoclinum faulkneri L2]|uniref:Uncharacterized protein n=1 Tax=Candidatus Endolissoclinum faulkneri L2 TaxID=1193729 RepID=K7YI44_9PROT|nr:hypothetical protein A1OE_1092 [Candidatus Endolissoclinum faulkneri L2]